MLHLDANNALKFSRAKVDLTYITKLCICLIYVGSVKFLSRQNFFYTYITSLIILIYFVAIAGNSVGTKIVLLITFYKSTNPQKSVFTAKSVRPKMI
jgi:hypothetical protein